MKRIAEALVECGYADTWIQHDNRQYPLNNQFDSISIGIDGNWIKCNPFADTLEGRRQADALEDWLHNEHYNIIQQAKVAEMLQKDNPNNDFMGQYNGRQKRLKRIKWCFDQLEKS